MRRIALALAILAAAGAWTGARADVVYLANGSRLVVDGWREDEDALAFFVGGGIVWIAKAEVTKIEEGMPVSAAPTVGPSTGPTAGAAGTAIAPPPPPPPPPRIRLDAADAVRRLLALLKQGEALFEDRFLSPAQKVRALQWLDDRWRELDVAEPLRQGYERGYRALQLAAQAFAALGAGATDAGARAAEAALAVRDAEAELASGRLP